MAEESKKEHRVVDTTEEILIVLKDNVVISIGVLNKSKVLKGIDKQINKKKELINIDGSYIRRSLINSINVIKR